LSDEERILALWWTGDFPVRERIFHDAEGLDRYLADFVTEHSPPVPRRGLRALRRKL
jgi:hypothetical protein